MQRNTELLLASDAPSYLQQSVHRGFCVSQRLSLSLSEHSHGLVLCVAHPYPRLCSSKDHRITYSLSLVVRAKRGALLCCRPSLQGQALLSHFGLDLSLTVHIQGVREQREWDMGAMRNKAEIPVPDPTSIHFPLHSTLFQRCCSARLNVIWLHKALAVCGHSRSACPLGD